MPLGSNIIFSCYRSGNEPQFYEEVLEYEVQTLVTMPTYWSISFDPATEITTVVYKGKSTICKKDFEEYKATCNVNEPKDPSSSGSRLSVSFIAGALVVAQMMALYAFGGW